MQAYRPGRPLCSSWSLFIGSRRLVTDSTYCDELRTDMASEVREVFAVRDAYLLARAGSVR